jgi:predicted acylesterase/phospholipase RssA
MRKADLYFTPPVGHYGLLEMDRIDELIGAGYRYGKRQLRAFAERGQLPGPTA